MGSTQKVTEQDLVTLIQELLDRELKFTDRICRRGGSTSSGAKRKRAFVVQDFEGPSSENVPRVLPTNEDPMLVNRNRRMLGKLLGTLEKCREEEAKISSSEAYMRRTDSLKRAEQKEHGGSEGLMLHEDAQIEETMRNDMVFRAIYANKAEEKILELLFLRWSEHQKVLGNFLRTKAEPPIYYSFAKQLEEDPTSLEERKKLVFQEWEASRREEVSQYLEQISEQNVAAIDTNLGRWLNSRKTRTGKSGTLNIQETADKELATQGLEPVSKKACIA